MEDHALERVPDAEREGWLQITWNTAGLITTLVILFFGAVVCFVAGVKIALAAGLVSFAVGSSIGWAMARIAWQTGCSNTLITRKYGLGIRGSALASLIFGFLIVGFLAVENGLLYRGFLFFFEIDDSWPARLTIYAGMSVAWILLTAFGFKLVTRFSSIMVIGFVGVLAWMIVVVLQQSGGTLVDALWFESQVQPAVLTGMGVDGDWDKFVFSLNILIGPACALALNTADFGRYGKSTADVGIAAAIAIFSQSVVVMLIGGILMKSGAALMIDYYITVVGMDPDTAKARVLQSPDSIAATFMVFGGLVGFVLMLFAQAKAQVLNSYSSSLCIANLADALFRWRPGRVTFVLLANAIALAMLYGHILELVEAWIQLMGVLLSALAGVIIMDYYFVGPRLASADGSPVNENESVNWSGVITILSAVFVAHFLLGDYFRLEVLSSIVCVIFIYPLLRLRLLRVSAA
ncbi:MAG: purine-cytosine permease-like transporter [Chromatiales bacterium]|jgi:cytosine permease|nr:purine-cytosine permease-like transporter [Chromatiales bacterium]